jgi:sulfate transport system substrate-binding protein
MNGKLLNALALALVAVAAGLIGYRNYDWGSSGKLLNVSYDPTREVYEDIDQAFTADYLKRTGSRIVIEQSHGGSSRQAQAVANGLAADVVTLALPSDIQSLVNRGLIAGDWRARLPHDSEPYYSTIVFVVRRSNPKHIKDWADLITPGVSIVTPDPKTSGNGKLSLLAAWGSVIKKGGNEAQARDFVRQLYRNVQILGQGARDAATKFALEGDGDVQLTWENEAIRESAESRGELQIVYPLASIRAEPSVTWVDANVANHQTDAAARAYLAFLFTEPAQEIFAAHGYRPFDDAVAKKYEGRLPPITLFPVTTIAKDWNDAQARFFGENGVYDSIQPGKIQ